MWRNRHKNEGRTEFKPKPMVEVGGKPVVFHIMKTCQLTVLTILFYALGSNQNM